MIPQWNDTRTTTLEEHFATAGFLDGPGRELKDQALKYNSSRAIRLIEKLCDVGDERLARMDAAHTDMQVLSLTFPGTEQLEAAERPYSRAIPTITSPMQSRSIQRP